MAQFYDVSSAPVVDAVQWDGSTAALKDIQLLDPSATNSNGTVKFGPVQLPCVIGSWCIKASVFGYSVEDDATFQATKRAV